MQITVNAAELRVGDRITPVFKVEEAPVHKGNLVIVQGSGLTKYYLALDQVKVEREGSWNDGGSLQIDAAISMFSLATLTLGGAR